MRIAAIVQARSGSNRLPGKVLLEVLKKPILQHQLERILRARQIDGLILATTDLPSDDTVAKIGTIAGCKVFRGSENDVLDRFYRAVRESVPDVIVRLTGDEPFMDPALVDEVIDLFNQDASYDYVSNTLNPTYPDGLDIEVFRFSALEAAWRNARLPSEREHVTPYIYNNSDLRGGNQFRACNHAFATDLSHLRWTLDERADFELVREVYERLYPANPNFGWMDVLALVTKFPRLMEVNAHIMRNEGYQRSLLADSAGSGSKSRYAKSVELFHRGSKVIPTASQTFSKCWTQFTFGATPLYIEKAKGCLVWDVDGNHYIDYAMALAPVILGYCEPRVDAAVRRQLEKGVTFTLSSPIEIEVAEKLCDFIPCADMVRFGKNGSDATSAAVRAARAYTGREIIACCGYHGWQDWFIGTTTRNEGVPASVRKLTVPFDYNDLASLEKIFREHPGQIAAVIMEPVGVVHPNPGFLEGVRALTEQNGSVLIFDEVITGFRMSRGGAQEYFKVVPDLAAFGKAMANGMPIAAVVGRRDIMNLFGEIFFSMTFGGEALSLAATAETLRILEEEKVLDQIWSNGRRLMEGTETLIRKHGFASTIRIAGYPPRHVFEFSDTEAGSALEIKSFFQQECADRGLLFSGAHNVSYAHTGDVIDRTLSIYAEVLESLVQAARLGVRIALRGQVVQPVFRRA